MTSALKIKANRANARTSTGPRTRQGKIRSAQNARRHGLSVSVLTDPLLSEDAEKLAHALAGEGASAAVLEPARRAAQAQINLNRIRKARHDLLVRNLRPDPPPNSNRAALVDGPLTDCPEMAKMRNNLLRVPRGATKVKVNVLYSEIPPEYAALDRYERRALSRRKFAIRELDAVCRHLARNGQKGL